VESKVDIIVYQKRTPTETFTTSFCRAKKPNKINYLFDSGICLGLGGKLFDEFSFCFISL